MSTTMELTEGRKVGRLRLNRKYVPERMPWEDDKIEKITYWICDCTCGETVTVEENKLIAGSVTSCRICKKKKAQRRKLDLSEELQNELEMEQAKENKLRKLQKGQVLGKLELLESNDSDPDYRKWKARCICGNISEYSERQLVLSTRPVRRCVNCK